MFILLDITKNKSFSKFENSYNLTNYLQYSVFDFRLIIKKKPEHYHSKLISRGHAYLIGTVMYKMLPYNKVLKSIHKDFNDGKLDLNLLTGNYTIIFWDDERIYFLNDKLGVQQVYFDTINKCFSSSFLYLVRNRKKKVKLNYDAFYEKLATGFILGDDTLFESIIKITPKNRKTELNNIKWIEHNYQNILDIELHSEGKNRSINKQIEHLGAYFNNVNVHFQNSIGDLGLSSGFDCRLILSLAEKHLKHKLHLHSHNTIGVHDTEIKYAKQLAEIYDSEIDLIPTRRLENSDEELLESVLKDNLEFFDGTSARHLGAFSKTYTFNYKKETLGQAMYSLNGLGGEIYRDSYFTGKEKMNWNDWVNRYIYFPFSLEAVGTQKQLDRTTDYIRFKLEQELNLNYDNMNIFSTHAYYSLIKMPQCNGAVASAYGKVSPFLFPFIEYDNIIEALKAVNYLGIGGQYQAEMINRISPKIASINSHYGFSYDKLSFKYLMWSKLKTLGGAKKRNNLVRKSFERKLNTPEFDEAKNFLNMSDTLKKSKDILLGFTPNTKFDVLLLESAQKRYIIYLAYMLNELIDYIDS